MSTTQQVYAAERRMNDAQDALRAHLLKPNAGSAEIAERNRLGTALQEAMNNYLRVVADLVRP